MQPPSCHSTFFSSLKQVQKRLKLEENLAQDSSKECLSAPIYVDVEQEPNKSSICFEESGEAPSAFLSSSIHETPQDESKTTIEAKREDVDEIEALMQLLGLSECGERGKGDEWCEEDSEFYERVVGAKGPKSRKQVERLEGWIRYIKEEGSESLSLAFLLLGKASCQLDSGLEFPSCVEEFLKLDPPTL